MNVIHISVAVVVDSCRSVLLRLIDPHVVREVRVGIFHRGVAYCNHNVRGAGCECPCILYTYIRALPCGFRDALVACVQKIPLIAVVWVVKRNAFAFCSGAESGCDVEWSSLEVRGQLWMRVELQSAYFRTPCHCCSKCISRDLLVKRNRKPSVQPQFMRQFPVLREAAQGWPEVICLDFREKLRGYCFDALRFNATCGLLVQKYEQIAFHMVDRRVSCKFCHEYAIPGRNFLCDRSFGL